MSITSMARHPQVVIVGGGIVGACTAYFLVDNPDFDGQVTVLERDPTYVNAATSLSAGSIRQQFSTAVNIRISQFGFDFLRRAADVLAVGDGPVSIGLQERTYLYLATPSGAATLMENWALQQSLGVAVEVLDAGALQQWLPWLSVDGIAAAARTRSGEGWLDPSGLLSAVRRKAMSLGARFLRASAEALVADSAGMITAVRLQGGDQVTGDWYVCAAGTRTPRMLATVGVEVPVSARKRTVYVFTSPAVTDGCPLVVDPSGLWLRPEGRGYICGITPDPDPPVDPSDFDPDPVGFEEAVWPLLAARIPGFESARSTRAWVGHYDYNHYDQNALIGWTSERSNLLMACGFSGHGLQQAPAVGRGLAELLVYGKYQTLDLSPLAYSRYLRGERLIEANVI